MIIFVVCMIVAGLLGVRHAIQSKVAHQVALDRETGTAALILRNHLSILLASYKRLDIERSLVFAACPVVPTPACPAAVRAFTIASKAECLVQQTIRASWLKEQLRWVARSALVPYPRFDFKISQGNEADLLTEWAEDFNQKTKKPFRLFIRNSKVASETQVERKEQKFYVAWTR